MQSRGTLKLIDGFYIGDGSSAEDEDFLLLNHVELVVNCAYPLQPNCFAHYGIRYFCLPFPAPPASALQQSLQLIMEALAEGGSVLVHGCSDLDSGATVGAIFLMQRFRWSLFKTLEFLHSRMPQLALQGESYELLKAHELLLLNQEGRLTYNWQARPQDTQELIVRNTFLNAVDSSIIRIPSQPSPSKTRRGRKRVSWVVQVEVVMESRQGSRQLRQEESQKSLRNQILNNVRKILNDKGREELPTKKSLDTLHSLPSPHPLKKHKSTYLLTSLPLLPHPHPQPLQEASPLRLHTECPQMGTSPSERKLRNKENMRTDGSQENHPNQSSRGSRRGETSAKKGSFGHCRTARTKTPGRPLPSH